jgi:hypothetical protein
VKKPVDAFRLPDANLDVRFLEEARTWVDRIAFEIKPTDSVYFRQSLLSPNRMKMLNDSSIQVSKQQIVASTIPGH